MKTYNIGVIGLGGRGRGLMRDVILHIGRGNVTAVCDKYEDRIELASQMVINAGQPEPEKYTDPTDKLGFDGIDDFADVKGQNTAKRALEIAAAGGHNCCILWLTFPAYANAVISRVSQVSVAA